jgi:hypothetical protein
MKGRPIGRRCVMAGMSGMFVYGHVPSSIDVNMVCQRVQNGAAAQ